MIHYTADPHFGHDNIINFCNRPFGSTKEMDRTLVENMNACVGADDDLYIIGDFGMGKTASQAGYLEEVFHSINGRKHLIRGNHDAGRVLDLPWESVSFMLEMKDDTRHVTMAHYPMITWNRARRGAQMLFGHVHDGFLGTRGCVNVGVDVWDFHPITIRDVLRRSHTLPVNPLWSEVEKNSEGPGM